MNIYNYILNSYRYYHSKSNKDDIMKQLQEMIKLFETHCIYEKNLSAKTIKAYNIDLKQFSEYRDSNNCSIDLFDKFYIKDYRKYLFELGLHA